MQERLPIMCPFNWIYLKMNYTKSLIFIFFMVIAFHLLPGFGLCEEIGGKLDFTLPAPENELHKAYLGLLNDDPFFIGQIKSDIVIIEIFSMYCPVCQREAPNVNTLFNLIQNSRPLNQKIKLIGIGAGNSPFEVDFFKKKYDIEFPLFSDPDFTIHKKIGAVRTPHFFGLALQGNGEFKVFYSQSGAVSDPEKFLKTLLKNSASKK